MKFFIRSAIVKKFFPCNFDRKKKSSLQLKIQMVNRTCRKMLVVKGSMMFCFITSLREDYANILAKHVFIILMKKFQKLHIKCIVIVLQFGKLKQLQDKIVFLLLYSTMVARSCLSTFC